MTVFDEVEEMMTSQSDDAAHTDTVDYTLIKSDTIAILHLYSTPSHFFPNLFPKLTSQSID